MATDFAEDIPLDLAIRAHAGTSHAPESRGKTERESYGFEMGCDFNELLGLTVGDYQKQATLARSFAKYRQKMASLKMAELHARSRCVSSMIAGPAKFPVARVRKASDTADKRREEMLDYRKRAMAEMRRELCPEDAPIMSGDGDAVERIRAKLDEAEKLQALMVAANRAIRRGDHGELGRLGMSVPEAASLLTPDSFGRIGYPDYKLKNNGAEIRRLRKRIEAVSAAKATPATSTEGDGVRMEDDPVANRVRLFFDGKPDANARAKLKRDGFRWTPTLGCWQAYRTSKEAAKAWLATLAAKEPWQAPAGTDEG